MWKETVVSGICLKGLRKST